MILRRVAVALTVSLLIGSAVTTGAFSEPAANIDVGAGPNKAFNPADITIRLGDSVTWTNQEAPGSQRKHTTTSNGFPDIPRGRHGIGLWNSGALFSGESFVFEFASAGTFPYHCTFHILTNMVGSVSVPVKAAPPSGPAGTPFQITLSTAPAPEGFVFDVQKKDPGGTFADWMTGVSSAAVIFDSTGQAPGTYLFRSRMRRLSDGGVSGYSPSRGVTVS